MKIVSARTAGSPFLWGAILFLLAFCTFLPTLKNDFINFDDPAYVLQNFHVNQGLTWAGLKWAFYGTVGGIWLPLTWITHMLDCQFYGLQPWGHHLTSVLIHAVNTALVFLWLRRATGATWRSFIVAALWGLHPLRVESVAWVAERKDVLSALFWLLTLLAYTEYVKKSQTAPTAAKKFYGWALVFFILGLTAKPMLVTLPFVLLLLDYWPFNRYRENKNVLPLVVEKWPFFVLMAIAVIITFEVQWHSNAVASLERLLVFDRIENAIMSYARYIGKTFWPENLSVFYPYGFWPLSTVLSAVALLVIMSLLFVWQRRRHPYLLAGWLWFLGTMIPIIGLAQIGMQAMADRYTYIPEIGLLVCLVWGTHALTRTRPGPPLVLSMTAIMACMALTYRQIGFWKNSEILFGHAIAVTGKNFVAHTNLGNALVKKGQMDEAMAQYQTALEINPGYADAHDNLGMVFLQKGRIDDAIVQYQKALEINPRSAEAHYCLGDALLQKGRIDEAIIQYQKALAINPDYVEAHNNLAAALMNIGKVEEAIVHYQKILELQPGNATTWNNLGMALFQQGKMDEAIAHYQKALEINPGYAEAHCNLGNAYLQKAQLDEAIGQYQKALEIKPDYAEAHDNLGTALMNVGRMEDAIVQYQYTLALQPENAMAHNNLGLALFQEGKTDDAIVHYQKALEINPDYAQACSNLGLAFFKMGRVQEAITSEQQALQLATAQHDAPLAAAIQARVKLFQTGSSSRNIGQTNVNDAAK